MPPEIAKYLFDVRRACGLLKEFTQGKQSADYFADAFLRSAVERQFTIVGEALLQAQKLDPKLTLHITALQQIIGFRNVLVHGYAVIKHDTVWQILQNQLPLLEREVGKLLASIELPGEKKAPTEDSS